MKKLIQSLAVILALALTLTGCGGEGQASGFTGNRRQFADQRTQAGRNVRDAQSRRTELV